MKENAGNVVHVLTYGGHPGGKVVGVFSSLDALENYMDNDTGRTWSKTSYGIHSFHLDTTDEITGRDDPAHLARAKKIRANRAF